MKTTFVAAMLALALAACTPTPTPADPDAFTCAGRNHHLAYAVRGLRTGTCDVDTPWVLYEGLECGYTEPGRRWLVKLRTGSERPPAYMQAWLEGGLWIGTAVAEPIRCAPEEARRP
jgi:hypothetical protein